MNTAVFVPRGSTWPGWAFFGLIVVIAFASTPREVRPRSRLSPSARVEVVPRENRGFVRDPEPTHEPITEAGLPIPPMQYAPWSISTQQLPPAIIAATAAMFTTGLADPRGCEYRDVTLAIGSVWTHDVELVATRGWVVPGTRWVIGWNGLLYPARAIGERARLATDFDRDPTLVPMLLRLGEIDLATAAWKALPPHSRAYGLGGPVASYRYFAVRFARAAFERAITAFMRGDDVDAAAMSRFLLGVRFAMMTAPVQHGDANGMLESLWFLEPINDLAPDLDRRRVRGPRPPLGPIPTIADLIEHLDDVAALQDEQPGRLSIRSDPRVVALMRATGAIEPLLATIENDNRLTRSVSFHRDFFPGRSIASVRCVALEAFMGMIVARPDQDITCRELDEDRATVMRRLRAQGEEIRREQTTGCTIPWRTPLDVTSGSTRGARVSRRRTSPIRAQ